MKSLDQQDAARTWEEADLINLSIAKGGTSVLTDACLVRGRLTDDEAEFMFAYGVLLQLMDDLQDLRDDIANGHTTIFTRQTGLGPLDAVTTRLWAFTRKVLWSFSRFGSAQPCSLKSLVQDNFRLLLLQSVARNQEFYTRTLSVRWRLVRLCASVTSPGRKRPWPADTPRSWPQFAKAGE